MRLHALAISLLAAAALAPVAAARSFTLPVARIAADVGYDGSVSVTEQITFRFHGRFTGAYREIPLRAGATVDDVSVAEGVRAYAPGAAGELGSKGAPGTFGTERTSHGLRVVWHYEAADQDRTFTIAYRLSGVAVAYDDVVDVDLNVWGGEWKVRLDRLDAAMTLPAPARGPAYRVFGAPPWVHPDAIRLPRTAELRAVDVPPRQAVELRVTFPRRLLPSVDGAQVRHGAGLAGILRAEHAKAAREQRDHERIQRAIHDIPRTAALLALLGLGPATALLGLVYWRFGRERRTSYDREHLQEPPSELAAALVPPLLRETTSVGADELAATLFDLIRRGYYTATPNGRDLELTPGDGSVALSPLDRPVAEIVDNLLAGRAVPLGELSGPLAPFQRAVGEEISSRRWFVDARNAVLLPAAVALAATGAILFWVGETGFRAVAPAWNDVALLVLGGCLVLNGIILGLAAAQRPLRRRRRPGAQAEAARWEAFERYLRDLPRQDVVRPASTELWDTLLVYGIALGLAHRVLQAAELHLTKTVQDASPLYWPGPGGGFGAGPTGLGIASLTSSFESPTGR